MKNITLLFIICAVFFSCKKNKKEEEDASWKSFQIEGGRTIRTVAEILLPLPQNYYGAESGFEHGIFYDTLPGISLSGNNLNSTYASRMKITNDFVLQFNTQKFPNFLTYLYPNTKYYVRAYRMKIKTGEVVLSNEISIKTTNETSYGNLSITQGSPNQAPPRIGYACTYYLDFTSKVGSSMSNYKDMLKASMRVEVDYNKARKNAYDLGSMTENPSPSGSMEDDYKFNSTFQEYYDTPLWLLISLDEILVSLPCTLAPGNHNIRILLDGYYFSLTVNAQQALQSDMTLSLSKSSALVNDIVYINGLSNDDATKSMGFIFDDKFLPILHDNKLDKNYLKVPSISKGTYKVRLFYNCDNPIIGNLTIK